MSPDQQEHLNNLNTTFVKLNTLRYQAGAQKYGTNLWEKPLLKKLYDTREELLDAFNYIQSAIDELERE